MSKKAPATPNKVVNIRVYFAGELVTEGTMAGQIVEMGAGK